MVSNYSSSVITFVFLSFFSVLFLNNSKFAEAQTTVNGDVSISARVGSDIVDNGGGGGGSSGGHISYISPEERKEIIGKADYNKDGQVDIIDLSILLFFYGQTGPNIAPYDLNGDGFIGLEDVSVMLYYWSVL